jgi:predicted nucleotidyltransferase
MSPADIAALLCRALHGREDVRVALLFGSHARGTAGAASDVDVAVDAPSVDPLDLAAELSLSVGAEVDVVPLDDPGVPLLEALVRDGIVVHEGSPGAGARWRSHALTTLETDGPWYARMRDAWIRRVAERGLSGG